MITRIIDPPEPMDFHVGDEVTCIGINEPLHVISSFRFHTSTVVVAHSPEHGFITRFARAFSHTNQLQRGLLMELSSYQRIAKTFAEYEDPLYPFLALAEESGEMLGLMAKALRGDDVDTRFGSREAYDAAILKEAGDVLWMLSQCLEELGLTLEDAAKLNIQKLEDRSKRGVIKGSGDNR